MEGSFELDDVCRTLLQAGVITITVVYTRTGTDAYARSVASHPNLDIYPHMSFELHELRGAFEKHVCMKESAIRPSSSKGSVLGEKLSPMELPFREGKSKLKVHEREALGRMTVSNAKRVIVMNNAGMVVKNGVSNLVAQESLIEEDLHLKTEVLYARMVCVADKIGNVKAIARISTALGLKIPGVSTLDQWWNRATVEQRLTLLSRGSKLDIQKALNNLSVTKRMRLEPEGALRCPFRGSSVDLEPVEASSRDGSDYE